MRQPCQLSLPPGRFRLVYMLMGHAMVDNIVSLNRLVHDLLPMNNYIPVFTNQANRQVPKFTKNYEQQCCYTLFTRLRGGINEHSPHFISKFLVEMTRIETQESSVQPAGKVKDIQHVSDSLNMSPNDMSYNYTIHEKWMKVKLNPQNSIIL